MAASPKLKALQQATKEYVSKERLRLTNEAAVLKAVMRTGQKGRGLQDVGIDAVSAVAEKDIASYLSGK